MSIGLHADGAFKIRSAKRANGVANYTWQIDGMQQELAPHQPPEGARTPFDSGGEDDAVIIFQLEPDAWDWEDDPAKAFFMKSGQRYNPFGSVRRLPGKPRLLAVRFNAQPSLGQCRFEFNLGVVVKQDGLVTPLLIDPGRDGKGVST
ncbi:MAG TPA: hypothetical protein PKH09_06575 [Parvularculaceae bacterium]|nr:hypothetical protein [Parvularculaceae bacterium]